MERKVITYKDFKEVAKKNEYFLWHFLQKDQEQNNLGFHSIFKKNGKFENQLHEILDWLKIPYYESYTEESIDFLLSSGINKGIWDAPSQNIIVNPKYLFRPVILLFKGYSLKSSTFQTCYCPEGVIDMIGKENPELLRDFN